MTTNASAPLLPIHLVRHKHRKIRSIAFAPLLLANRDGARRFPTGRLAPPHDARHHDGRSNPPELRRLLRPSAAVVYPVLVAVFSASTPVRNATAAPIATPDDSSVATRLQPGQLPVEPLDEPEYRRQAASLGISPLKIEEVISWHRNTTASLLMV